MVGGGPFRHFASGGVGSGKGSDQISRKGEGREREADRAGPARDPQRGGVLDRSRRRRMSSHSMLPTAGLPLYGLGQNEPVSANIKESNRASNSPLLRIPPCAMALTAALMLSMSSEMST